MSHRPTLPDLPPPARYTPFLTGRYDVKPNLKKFGVDFGNGPADRLIFQLDDDFPRYRSVKLAALQDAPQRHHIEQGYSPHVAAAVAQFIARRLAAEHPAYFNLAGSQSLHCRLTGQTIDLHTGAFDSLARQLQEDLAVTVMEGDRQWIAALHICLPSHWTPHLKIGRSFSEVHTVVPGMQEINRRENDYVKQMISAVDGLARFVWGIQRGDELNRHPDSPLSRAGGEWFIRVERQTIWGLPEVNASLFTIRPYLMSGAEIREVSAWRDGLIAGLRGMSEESARYKGVLDCRDELINWLAGSD